MNDVALKSVQQQQQKHHHHPTIINSKRQTKEKKIESRLQYEDSGRHSTTTK